MDRLRDTVRDFIFTLVNEQRTVTGEFSRVDAERYASLLLDAINRETCGHVVIDTTALNRINDIGTRLAMDMHRIPSYPALVMLALQTYIEYQGVVPNFEVVTKV